MNIKEIVFQFTETKTYTLTMSKENGWDMPENHNELIATVNDVSNRPSHFIKEDECEVTSEVEFNSSDVIDNPF